MSLCRNSGADQVREILGISPGLAEWVDRNAQLDSSPTAPAALIYSGVLFGELGLTEMSDAEFGLAKDRLLIFSALFGALRPDDQICCYRLSGGVELPDIGRVTKFWREPLAEMMTGASQDRLVVDMRSSPYTGMWSPTPDQREMCVVVKVWQESASGQRTAVSHHNKASKGQLARQLATSPTAPGDASHLLELVTAQGWRAELSTNRKSEQLDLYLPAP